MPKSENVIKYYVYCNKLKDVVRTGWKVWGVKRERVESIAEHIFGTCMLAIAMYSEYNYDVDIYKVVMMLAIHETEEIIIGDYTPYQITKQAKKEIGHKAVKTILKDLTAEKELFALIEEFDERKTKEAWFAHLCDKLECDIQSRLYDLENCVDLNNQQHNKIAFDPLVRKMLSEGQGFSEMWINVGQQTHGYDKNFMEVSEYAKTHNILMGKKDEK